MNILSASAVQYSLYPPPPPRPTCTTTYTKRSKPKHARWTRSDSLAGLYHSHPIAAETERSTPGGDTLPANISISYVPPSLAPLSSVFIFYWGRPSHAPTTLHSLRFLLGGMGGLRSWMASMGSAGIPFGCTYAATSRAILWKISSPSA